MERTRNSKGREVRGKSEKSDLFVIFIAAFAPILRYSLISDSFAFLTKTSFDVGENLLFRLRGVSRKSEENTKNVYANWFCLNVRGALNEYSFGFALLSVLFSVLWRPILRFLLFYSFRIFLKLLFSSLKLKHDCSWFRVWLGVRLKKD